MSVAQAFSEGQIGVLNELFNESIQAVEELIRQQEIRQEKIRQEERNQELIRQQELMNHLQQMQHFCQ